MAYAILKALTLFTQWKSKRPKLPESAISLTYLTILTHIPSTRPTSFFHEGLHRQNDTSEGALGFRNHDFCVLNRNQNPW